MGKPKSKPQMSLLAGRVYDDWGGLPSDHWSYRFHEHVFWALDDAQFGDLYETGGRQPLSPRLLVCVTLLQYMQRVSDRSAVERSIDSRSWRIALGIELGYEGFHLTVLCYFRKRLLVHDQGRRVFETVLSRLQELGLLKGHTKVRVDATKLIADVAVLSRADMVREALRKVVCSLAELRPTLLKQRADFKRLYDRYHREYWLGGADDGDDDLRELARDATLLRRLCGPYPAAGRATLAQILDENFRFVGAEPEPKPWDEILPGHIATPHEPDAEVGKQADQIWTGDKVHVVETVTDAGPGFVVDVLVTGPRVPDATLLPSIAERLAQALPEADTLLADGGYSSAANSRHAAREGLDLISPPRRETCRGTIPAREFALDFERQVARCPQGHESNRWRVGKRLYIKFPRGVCAAGPRRSACTTSPTEPRTLTLAPQYEQLLQDRARARTEEFAEAYAQRAGVEATISELVHCCGLRRSRYRKRPKRELHALLASAALNVRRLLRALAAPAGEAAATEGAILRLSRALTTACQSRPAPLSAALAAP
ncbi:MAG: transposase [Planctomycetota bacterium]|nr:transposase [Planctomycetota bacterium]